MAAKNEAKIRFSAETKEFDNGIKSANGALSTLRSELKLNEAQMRANGTSVEGLRAKQQNLSEQMEAAKKKTQNLSDKLEVAVAIFGENSAEANKLRGQLLGAQTAEAKLQGDINRCNAELERQEQAAKKAESASGKLSDEISDQQKELRRLKDAYADAVLEFGEGSDEAKALAGEIDDLSGKLKANKKRMDDAAKAADGLDKSLDDAEDRDSGGFTVLKGALADLVSEGIQYAISSVSDLVSYFAELPAATMELRQDFGTLTTAFDNVGFSTQTATDTWRELYKVFGEDDRAVETANNIARIASNEKELNEWVTITTGIWGTYQDSLPVEGLAEAAAETAKTGTVTGGLADALNWSSEAAVMFADYMSEDVVTAEDAFNAALAECTTEQERQALITDTLSKLYGGAADKYRETTSAQMEAKAATADQILAENDLAAAIEPVTTAWQGMKNEMLVGYLPAIEAVSDAMLSALDWMEEHPVAMKVISAVIAVVAAALAALTVVTVAQTVAQWALNSAILANPITWIVVGIVAAIAAVVAIIIVVIEYWDQIVAAVSSAWESIKSTLSEWGEWISANVIQPVAEFFTGLWTDITTACTSAWESTKTFFSDLWESITSTAETTWSGIVTFFSDMWESITSTATTAWDSVLAFFAGIPGWFDENVIQPVIGFFTGLWEGLVSIWNYICDFVQFSIMLIGSIISAAVDIITLPFMFIWENCKEYVFAAWDWIMNAVMTAGYFLRDIIVTVFSAVANFFVGIWEGIKSVVGIAWDWISEKVTIAVNIVSGIITTVMTAVSTFFIAVWEGIKTAVSAAWAWITERVTTAVNIVSGIISTAMTAISTFFVSVWEGIKSAVAAAWDWISEKVTAAINTVSGIISSVMEAIRNTISTIWEGIKNAVAMAWDWITEKVTSGVNAVRNVVTSVFNGIKSVATSVWNGIKNAIANVVNGIKSTVSSVFNSVKSTATSVWNGIKNAILTPIEAAKEKVKGVVDAIKGFFSGMKLELPNIKLPHFEVTGKLSISPPSVPKLSIEWYKEGGIMTSPTIFGMNGNSLMAGGEAGPEAILPIDKLQTYISAPIDRFMQSFNINALVAAVEDLANRAVELNINGRQFAVATAADTDNVSGNRLALTKRGLAL